VQIHFQKPLKIGTSWKWIFEKGDDNMYGNDDNTVAMMEFTEVLKNEPKKAYDYISNNAYRFTKDGLSDIIKELLYSLNYHIGNNFYGDLQAEILEDVQIELDEQYDEAYQEYSNEIEKLNKEAMV
jgi:hypothetical protein